MWTRLKTWWYLRKVNKAVKQKFNDKLNPNKIISKDSGGWVPLVLGIEDEEATGFKKGRN